MADSGEVPTIPENEFTFTASRSSGPGGQNVNKVSSRVTVRFNIRASASLTDKEKGRIIERLASRINRKGVLQVTSQRHRTQAANREAALKRLSQLLADALRDDPPRKVTRVPEASKKQRLEEKLRRAQLKRRRSWKGDIANEEY